MTFTGVTPPEKTEFDMATASPIGTVVTADPHTSDSGELAPVHPGADAEE